MNLRKILFCKKNLKKYCNISKHCFVIFIFLVASSQFSVKAQRLAPQNQNAEVNILEKLLPDGSAAPNISGHIFHKKPKTKIASKEEFEKSLKQFQINLRGKITILQFWERKCKYCKLVLPELEKVYAKYKNKGVQFYAVNPNDFNDKAGLIDFLNAYSNTKSIFNIETNQYYEKSDAQYYKPFDIPILFASQDSKQHYGVTAFPAVFVIDKKGIVYTAMIGYFEEYADWLSEVIDGLQP